LIQFSKFIITYFPQVQLTFKRSEYWEPALDPVKSSREYADANADPETEWWPLHLMGRHLKQNWRRGWAIVFAVGKTHNVIKNYRKRASRELVLVTATW